MAVDRTLLDPREVPERSLNKAVEIALDLLADRDEQAARDALARAWPGEDACTWLGAFARARRSFDSASQLEKALARVGREGLRNTAEVALKLTVHELARAGLRPDWCVICLAQVGSMVCGLPFASLADLHHSPRPWAPAVRLPARPCWARRLWVRWSLPREATGARRPVCWRSWLTAVGSGALRWHPGVGCPVAGPARDNAPSSRA